MLKPKAQKLFTLPLALLLVILGQSNIIYAQNSTCVPLAVPQVVDSGGKLWSVTEKVTKQDGQALILGSHTTSETGWVTLDFGCFTDSPGPDLEVYEIGTAEGGEVYVGNTLPARKNWVHIPADLEGCGNESLPEKIGGCGVVGDKWLALDIGGNDGQQYRYVQIESDGSAIDEKTFGGSSDIDAVRVFAPDVSVDLFTRVDGEDQTSLNNLPVGSHVVFVAEVSGDYTSDMLYKFTCGTDSTFKNGTMRTTEGEKHFACDYPQGGLYTATITLLSPAGEISDTVPVAVGQSLREDSYSSDGPTSRPLPLRLFIWGTIVALLGYAVIKFLHLGNNIKL